MTARPGSLTSRAACALGAMLGLATPTPAGTPFLSPLPPLVAWSDAGTGTRPLAATTLVDGSCWRTPTAVAAPGPFTAPGWPLHWKVARTSPDRSQQVVLFQEDDESLRDRLWATLWNGTAWSAGDGSPAPAVRLPSVNGATLWSDSRQFDAAYEEKSGRLLVVSGINTVDNVVYWTHSGSAWSSYTMASLPAGNSGVYEWVRLAARPASNQVAFLGLSNGVGAEASSFSVGAAIWDGDSGTWGGKQVLSFTAASGAGRATEAIDVAFAPSGARAGEAVFVWGRANVVYSRTWSPAAGWQPQAVAAQLPAGSIVRWLRLAADPAGDDMVLAIGDSDGGTGRLATVAYDGATRAWGGLSPFHALAAFGDPAVNRPFDVSWDPAVDARGALLVYADANGLWHRRSSDGGAQFGGRHAVDELEPAYWVELERHGEAVDLAVQDQSNDLRAWRWNGHAWTSTTSFPLSSALETGVAHGVEPFALAGTPAARPVARRGDFDADGKTDLLWHNETTGALFVWFLDGAVTRGSSYLRPESFADTRWQIRAIGDFNRDRKTDVLWHHKASGDLYVWYLDGTTAVGGAYLQPRGVSDPAWQVRAAADFDADGGLDLLWQHGATGDLYLWLMDGAAVRAGSALTPAGVADTTWELRGAADIDGDGHPDLLWHNQATGDVYTWLMKGTSAASGRVVGPGRVDPRWRLSLASDLNDDGRSDLLWHNRESGELYIWYLDGTTVASAGYLSPSRFKDPRWWIVPR